VHGDRCHPAAFMGRADVHEKKVRSVGRWQLELSYCLAMHKSTVAPHWLAPLRFATCLVFGVFVYASRSEARGFNDVA